MGTFQALSQYWTNDIIDPDELVGFAVLPESAEAFHTGWENAEAQDLTRQGAAETDPQKRKGDLFPDPGDPQRGITDAAALLPTIPQRDDDPGPQLSGIRRLGNTTGRRPGWSKGDGLNP